jgi:hypothetical protein
MKIISLPAAVLWGILFLNLSENKKIDNYLAHLLKTKLTCKNIIMNCSAVIIECRGYGLYLLVFPLFGSSAIYIYTGNNRIQKFGQE